MSQPLTALGTESAEGRVRGDLSLITRFVLERVLPEDVACLALTGGFGRGEGGVVAGADGGLTAFNDYDLVVVTRRSIDGSSILAAAPGLAERLGVDFIDFGIFPESVLSRVPATVFWYELREGHRVLAGDADAILRIPRFDPGKLPLVEAVRLLLNRGLSLLWAWIHLEESERTGIPLERKAGIFAVNSIHKAVLSIGDAALIRAGRYDLSYRTRAVRVSEVPLPFNGTEKSRFLEAHAAATQFKLFPDPGTASSPGLVPWWTEVRGWHETAFRWIEEARIGREIGPWSNYVPQLAVESLRMGLRHPRRYLGERGGTELLRGWGRHLLDSEHAQRARLPFLLYGAGPSGFDRNLLSSGLRGFPEEPDLVRARWREASLDLLREWHP